MSQGMFFDYNAPAELFLAKRTKNSREKYRRFATAAEAIRYAVETLRTPKAFGAWLEVGDERFNSAEIERLYEALPKKGASGAERKKFGTRPKRAATSRSKSLWLVFPDFEVSGKSETIDTAGDLHQRDYEA